MRWDAYQAALCIQMSWKMALDTIDARLGLRSAAENESLGRWKITIEKAFTDFRGKCPGFAPGTLPSLVIALDGRLEGSNFPNLVVPKERERFDL